MPKRQVRHAPPGARSDAHGKAVENKILVSIPEGEFALIRPRLEYVNLRRYSVLHEPGQDLEYAYFPNEGMISLVIATQDGKTVEVGVVGKEGFAGIPVAIGLNKSLIREVVQIPGEAFRVNVDKMRSVLQSAHQLQIMLNHYVVVQGMQVAQTAACNRLHRLERRLARWLLMTQDRAASESLHITHDFLATMLGTDRPSLSLAASVLQEKKIIEYTRGAVRIVNRKKLLSSACECYEVIKQFSDQIGLR